MRIGADVGKVRNAQDWALAHREREYGACIFPVADGADASETRFPKIELLIFQSKQKINT